MEEVNVASLCGFAGNQFSNCQIRVRIPMFDGDMDRLNDIFAAEEALHKIGVRFDAGLGGGYRDWEFDYSLSGAVVQAQKVYCMACRQDCSGELPCLVLDTGAVRPFCSDTCRDGYAIPEDREAIKLTLNMVSLPERSNNKPGPIEDSQGNV